MGKSIADLIAERADRAEPIRPESTYRAVVGEGQRFVVEAQRLTAEQERLTFEEAEEMAAVAERPRKGKGGSQRLTEIRAALKAGSDRLAELHGLMGEYEGELLLRGTKTDGEWAQWRIEHPARTDDDGILFRDDAIKARGACNFDDLIEDLATYVVAWNGEPLPPGGYDALELLLPDKRAIAARVVGMYEQGADLPKWRSVWSAHLTSEPFSDSPSE